MGFDISFEHLFEHLYWHHGLYLLTLWTLSYSTTGHYCMYLPFILFKPILSHRCHPPPLTFSPPVLPLLSPTANVAVSYSSSITAGNGYYGPLYYTTNSGCVNRDVKALAWGMIYPLTCTLVPGTTNQYSTTSCPTTTVRKCYST